MDFIQVVTFTMVALLLVVSPGPNGVLIAKTVPISGKGAGFANVSGFLTAFYLHGTLSILGISVILTKSSQVFFIVKMLGAIYLIWIGVKALLAAFKPSEELAGTDGVPKRQRALLNAYVEGFITNALNPKVSMFYLAAFPQFITIEENAVVYAFILVSIHAFMNAAWFSLMVLLLAKLRSLTNRGYFQKILKAVTGIVFITFGVKLVSMRVE